MPNETAISNTSDMSSTRGMFSYEFVAFHRARADDALQTKNKQELLYFIGKMCGISKGIY